MDWEGFGEGKRDQKILKQFFNKKEILNGMKVEFVNL